MDTKSGPWLMYDEKQSHTVFSLKERTPCKRRNFNFRQSPEDECFPTPQGWMLMAHPRGEYCYLLDPVTMERKDLPSLECNWHTVSNCVLSSSPSSDDCKLLVTLLYKWLLLLCRLSDKEWTCHRFNHDNDDYLIHLVSDNGKFYGLTKEHNLAFIDCSPPRPQIHFLDQLSARWPMKLPDDRRCLVESGGEMFMVTRRCYRGWRRSLKRDSSKRSWETINNIGGRVILLGHCGRYASSCSAREAGGKGNCIYYVEEEDRSIYCFDLEEGCNSVHLPPRPPARRNKSTPIWIIPAL